MYWTQKIAFAFRGNGFTFFMILPFSRNPKKPFPAAHSEGTSAGPRFPVPGSGRPEAKTAPGTARLRPLHLSPAGPAAARSRRVLSLIAPQCRSATFLYFSRLLPRPAGGQKSESALPEKEARFHMPGQPPVPGPRFRYRPADRWAAGSFCSRTR